MITEYLTFAFKGLTKRKLRSYLTIIGIFIGVAAVVALISIAQGMQTTITGQFEKFGANKIMIMPGGGGEFEFFGAFSAGKLTKDDLSAVQKASGVDTAAQMYYKVTKIKFKDQTKSTFVIGLPTDESAKIIESIQGFEAVKGRELKSEDKYKITIGWRLWNKDFFDKSVSLRDNIEIEGQKFSVVGLISKIGNRADDSQVYIPLDTAREILNAPEEISAIYAETKQGYAPDKVAEDIKKELRETRNEKKGEETFSVQTFEQMLASISSILGVVQAILIGISAIALLVGGIGIMNSMYTSVLERTREIGVMKAIGARNIDIALIFLFESGLIGLAGGIIGIALGIGIAKVVELGAQMYGIAFKAAITPTIMLASLLFSFLVGIISGTTPSLRAAKLKPVEALRYE